MKALLETTSPKYLRRLVRALNGEAMTGNGFYFRISAAKYCPRANRARFSGGLIECKEIGTGEWLAALPESFCDCNGREIVASRQAKP